MRIFTSYQYINKYLTAFGCPGEWTNELAYKGASRAEYEMLGKAQLEVYSEATAGWAYWNYITEDSPHWDFSRNYKDGYMLKPVRGWNNP